jgi:hypothetical protein
MGKDGHTIYKWITKRERERKRQKKKKKRTGQDRTERSRKVKENPDILSENIAVETRIIT